MKKIKAIYIDGGCLGNNQKDPSKREMRWAVSDEEGNIILEGKKSGGSNNIAEFIALLEALKYVRTNNLRFITIKTDSKNNIRWNNSLKEKNLKKMNDGNMVKSIKEEVEKIKKKIPFKLEFVPRAENLAGHYLEENYNL